ncbi:2650_t:CDS:2 [Ambispora leptoticha]|uniref:peptidyl-tRNA hydrolase n=1 Tax=Ambispora leptoticha TaxID=144679 RepID=A0A9N9F626_9GLOM|nr:2650_t:CDS:2 [Ambispora leptoticha]
MLLLDYLAEQYDLTWTRHKNWPGCVAKTTISIQPPPSPKKVKQKKPKQDKHSCEDSNNGACETPKIPSEPENNVLMVNENQLNGNNNDAAVTTRPTTTNPPSSSIIPKKNNEKILVSPSPIIQLDLTLMKPSLLMNISGRSVSQAVKELRFSLSNIIVIHDDMERELGKISIKNGGSANGHNGIKSLIDCLKTNQFRRLRIGIGRPHSTSRSHDVVSDYVLSHINSTEMQTYKLDVFPRCQQELLKFCAESKNGIKEI